ARTGGGPGPLPRVDWASTSRLPAAVTAQLRRCRFESVVGLLVRGPDHLSSFGIGRSGDGTFAARLQGAASSGRDDVLPRGPDGGGRRGPLPPTCAATDAGTRLRS